MSSRLNFNILRKKSSRFFSVTPNCFHSKETFKFNQSKYLHKLPIGEVLRTLNMSLILAPSIYVSFNILGITDYSKFMNIFLLKAIVTRTVFRQYVGGENVNELILTTQKLKQRGIGSVIDYAVESDINSIKKEEAESKLTFFDQWETLDLLAKWAKWNQQKDTNIVSIEDASSTYFKLLESIEAASKLTNEKFIAVKITALIDTSTLMSTNNYLTTLKNFYVQACKNNESLSLQGFTELLQKIGVKSLSQTDAFTLYKSVMSAKESGLSFQDVLNLLGPTSPVRLLFKNHIEDSSIIPSTKEFTKCLKLKTQLNEMAKYSSKNGVRVLIDSEQTYFQNAIRFFALETMEKFNTGPIPIVYNTYPCYLKASLGDLKEDISIAEKSTNKYKFAAKLVRGAYMISERQLAKEKGIPSPVHESYDDTTKSFHACINLILESVAKEQFAVIIGTHNENSIEYAIERMRTLNIKESDSSVCFAQLYGMSDAMALQLAEEGYRVFKYIPYGPVKEVIPYLSRRIQENGSIMESNKKQRKIMFSEFIYRLSGGLIKK